MNINRLSTNKAKLNTVLESEELDLKVKALLEEPKSGVWVYDSLTLGKLVEGSPFPNITQACKALSIGPRSSYLNSGKSVNGRYYFYSNSQDENMIPK